MILDMEKVRSTKLYSVGHISEIDKYAIAITVPWIAWYEQYYEISEEEYSLFEKDIDKLDMLAEDIRYGKGKERFLFSDKVNENSKENRELYDLCRKIKT